jgi:hypothetical protein
MSNGDPNYPQDQWWYAGCAANAASYGWPLCDTTHCDDSLIVGYTESYCTCVGQFVNGCAPNRTPNCCVFNAETAVPIAAEKCYCCCGCFANGTPVAYDATAYKSIEDFLVGDLVYVADDATLSSWSQQKVLWSAGAGPGNNPMLMVAFESGATTDFLIVNRAQPFLMPDRTVRRAVTLVPGRDELVGADGSPHKVLSLTVGAFANGLHHVATSRTPAKSVDRHLLLAKGIVCGDWALQVALTLPDSNTTLAPGHGSLPEIGTRAYHEAYAELQHSSFHATVADVTHATPPSDTFQPYGTGGVYIPENAQGFVSAAQAWELLENSYQVPPNSGTNQELIAYLFKLFGAFNTDIRFYLDNETQTPNAYFFEAYGQRTIVVTGGLIRTTALGMAGLAAILAHAIGASYTVAPVNDEGYSCTAQADYTAFTAILNQVFTAPQALPLAVTAIEQITKLFSAVHENRGGSDKCMNVSLDCRLEAMQAGLDMLALPPCAGGPPAAALSVLEASGVIGTPHGTVTVSFDEPVDPTTGAEVANYAFEPLVTTYSAAVGSDPTTVAVTADLKPDVAYEVVVTGVLSSEQAPLTSADSAQFTPAAEA